VAIKKSAVTAELQRLQRSSGNGNPPLKSGIGGLSTVNHGCTGAHPRVVSPLKDGLGIEATGITVALPSNTRKAPGLDTRTDDGLPTIKECLSTHLLQEV